MKETYLSSQNNLISQAGYDWEEEWRLEII